MRDPGDRSETPAERSRSIRAKWLLVGLTGGFVFSNILASGIESKMSRAVKMRLGMYSLVVHYTWPLGIWVLVVWACFAWGTKAQKLAAASWDAADLQNQIVRYFLLISAILFTFFLWMFLASLPLATMKG
jgi:hypothetical protein